MKLELKQKTPFFLAGKTPRVLHSNFYLQSYTQILKRELLRFVQKTKDISVLLCESRTEELHNHTEPQQLLMLCLVRLKLEDHLFQEVTLIHLHHTVERIPYFKPCS